MKSMRSINIGKEGPVAAEKGLKCFKIASYEEAEHERAVLGYNPGGTEPPGG